MLKITIMGCGWLGLPLALSLKQLGYQVVGSKRSVSDAQVLNQHDIQGFAFDLFSDWQSDELYSDLKSDWLILNIPPKRKLAEHHQFAGRMKQLIDMAYSAGCDKILFISTTSVYGNVTGRITETSPTEPVTSSGQAHLQLEQHLQLNHPLKHQILRLAGLIDQQRHPATSLSGREVKGGNEPVNLIHKQDVIRAIHLILNQSPAPYPLHLSASHHPKRNEYYSWACRRLKLVEPKFTDKIADFNGDNAQFGKLIDPTTTLNYLGLTLEYDDPYTMLDA
jgi:nucleoside-diphosphate-sugar epimerase